MAPRLFSQSVGGRFHTLAAIGDSLTYNITLGVRPDQFWPEVVASTLRGQSTIASVKARNFAISGNTTANVLARFAAMTQFETPDIAVIWAGVNDTTQVASVTSTTVFAVTAGGAAAIPLVVGQTVNVGTQSSVITIIATDTITVSPAFGVLPVVGQAVTQTAYTQAKLQAMIRWLKNSAAGSVADQTLLPAGQLPGTRYIVVVDGSTTGGVLPTLSGTQAGVQVWESRNGLAGVAGWGRIISTATAVSRILVGTPQFLNYTSGADTIGVTGSHSGQGSAYNAIHTACQAAATAESVIFVDIYSYMQDRIINGYDTAASASWHVAGTNQHLNQYGQWLVAQAMMQAIAAQTGWTATLQS